MKSVAIIGAGPAGLFTALTLVKNDNINVYVIDKGKDLTKRRCVVREGKNCIHCNPCNIMCGFGGAGTYSDCKLSLTPYGVGGNIVDYVGPSIAESLVKEVDTVFSYFDSDRDSRIVVGEGNTEIYKHIESKLNNVGLELTNCPTKHLGTDGTFNVMSNLYATLVREGVKFIFNTEVVDIEVSGDKKVVTLSNDGFLCVDYVVLAPGRSGNEWLSNLVDKLGIHTESNGFDLGVRVELPSSILKELTDNLYDMKISKMYDDGVKARTFCTNPNGFVSEEHYDSGIVLANGHSYANKKSDNTNFAVLVHYPNMTTQEAKDMLKRFYSAIGDSKLVMSTDFGADTRYTKPTLETEMINNKDFVRCLRKANLPSNFNSVLLDFLHNLSRAYPGVLGKGTTNFYCFEAKFYSDRIKVNKDFETAVPGIYCIGDGSGISRGIVQASGMGIVAARSILNKTNTNK